jgi:hypothetical protein
VNYILYFFLTEEMETLNDIRFTKIAHTLMVQHKVHYLKSKVFTWCCKNQSLFLGNKNKTRFYFEHDIEPKVFLRNNNNLETKHDVP